MTSRNINGLVKADNSNYLHILLASFICACRQRRTGRKLFLSVFLFMIAGFMIFISPPFSLTEEKIEKLKNE